MKKLVIALTGTKGAGKDEFANYLVALKDTPKEKLGNYFKDPELVSCFLPHVRTIAFADKAKAAAASILGVPLQIFYKQGDKDSSIQKDYLNGDSPRDFVRELAEGMKKRYPRLWAATTYDEIERAPQESIFIITDQRFLVENREALEERNNIELYTVLIIDPKNNGDDIHISEVEMSQIVEDFSIINHKTPNYYNQVLEVFEQICADHQ